MAKSSPLSVFLAGTSLMVAVPALPVAAQGGGGLKEWTTDQGVDEKSTMDADAKKLMKKAVQEAVCVTIGEGENCW